MKTHACFQFNFHALKTFTNTYTDTHTHAHTLTHHSEEALRCMQLLHGSLLTAASLVGCLETVTRVNKVTLKLIDFWWLGYITQKVTCLHLHWYCTYKQAKPAQVSFLVGSPICYGWPSGWVCLFIHPWSKIKQISESIIRDAGEKINFKPQRFS